MNFSFGRSLFGRFIFAGKIGNDANEHPKGETKNIIPASTRLLPMRKMEQGQLFSAAAVRRIL